MSRPAAPQPPRRSSWPAVLVTLGAGLAVLMTVGVFVPPFALLMALGFGAATIFFTLHYFVWGRWLRQALRDDEEVDATDPP